jgi:hypothetical protein
MTTKSNKAYQISSSYRHETHEKPGCYFQVHFEQFESQQENTRNGMENLQQQVATLSNKLSLLTRSH